MTLRARILYITDVREKGDVALALSYLQQIKNDFDKMLLNLGYLIGKPLILHNVGNDEQILNKVALTATLIKNVDDYVFLTAKKSFDLATSPTKMLNLFENSLPFDAFKAAKDDIFIIISKTPLIGFDLKRITNKNVLFAAIQENFRELTIKDSKQHERNLNTILKSRPVLGIIRPIEKNSSKILCTIKELYESRKMNPAIVPLVLNDFYNMFFTPRPRPSDGSFEQVLAYSNHVNNAFAQVLKINLSTIKKMIKEDSESFKVAKIYASLNWKVVDTTKLLENTCMFFMMKSYFLFQDYYKNPAFISNLEVTKTIKKLAESNKLIPIPSKVLMAATFHILSGDKNSITIRNQIESSDEKIFLGLEEQLKKIPLIKNVKFKNKKHAEDVLQNKVEEKILQGQANFFLNALEKKAKDDVEAIGNLTNFSFSYLKILPVIKKPVLQKQKQIEKHESRVQRYEKAKQIQSLQNGLIFYPKTYKPNVLYRKPENLREALNYVDIFKTILVREGISDTNVIKNFASASNKIRNTNNKNRQDNAQDYIDLSTLNKNSVDDVFEILFSNSLRESNKEVFQAIGDISNNVNFNTNSKAMKWYTSEKHEEENHKWLIFFNVSPEAAERFAQTLELESIDQANLPIETDFEAKVKLKPFLMKKYYSLTRQEKRLFRAWNTLEHSKFYTEQERMHEQRMLYLKDKELYKKTMAKMLGTKYIKGDEEKRPGYKIYYNHLAKIQPNQNFQIWYNMYKDVNTENKTFFDENADELIPILEDIYIVPEVNGKKPDTRGLSVILAYLYLNISNSTNRIWENNDSVKEKILKARNSTDPGDLAWFQMARSFGTDSRAFLEGSEEGPDFFIPCTLDNN